MTARLDPAVRRSQIVDAALRVFVTRDPVEVTFEEVAESAGVSRALVYNYFGDRGGLIAAVYLRSVERLDDELNAAVDGALPPVERVRGIVKRYLEAAHSHPGAWRLLLAVSSMEHPTVVAARRQRIDQLAEAWGGGPEARISACGVVGLLESTTLEWLRRRDLDLDRAADVIFDLAWNGLAGVERHGINLPARRPAVSVPT